MTYLFNILETLHFYPVLCSLEK